MTGELVSARVSFWVSFSFRVSVRVSFRVGVQSPLVVVLVSVGEETGGLQSRNITTDGN